MPIETGDKVEDLNPNWPLGSDAKAEGDDHIRLIKTVLQTDVVSGTGTGPASVKSVPTFDAPLQVRRTDSLSQTVTIDGGDVSKASITIDAGSAKSLAFENNTAGSSPFTFSQNGTLVATVRGEGPDATLTTTVMTREKADARYVAAAGGEAFNLTARGNYLDVLSDNPGTRGLVRIGQLGSGSIEARRDGYGTLKVNSVASAIEVGDTDSDLVSNYFRARNPTSGIVFQVQSPSGNVQNLNNSYGAISDVSLKENVKDMGGQLTDLLKLRPVSFNLKGDTLKQAGLIAQEVEAVKPGLVDTDPETGLKSVKYSVLVPLLLKAVQELTARVEALEA